MITSPGDSSFDKASIVDSVGSPAGTITQTWRGAFSALTRSSSDPAPLALTASAFVIASALRSKATMSWPPRSRRVTMLSPILPSPTKPSCIDDLLFQYGLCELLQQRAVWRRKVSVKGAPARGIERREVADRLRHLERAERKLLARDRPNVLPRRRGDEQEHAVVGAAFVQLTRRMEVARTEAEHRRRACP